MKKTLLWLALAATGWAQSLEIAGQVPRPHTYTTAELSALAAPLQTEKHTYSAIKLSDLLNRAGVPSQHDLKGKWMAAYLVARGADGYRVVFSLAELDPLLANTEVWVAVQEDGKLRLVVLNETRQARWLRDLQSLKLELAP